MGWRCLSCTPAGGDQLSGWAVQGLTMNEINYQLCGMPLRFASGVRAPPPGLAVQARPPGCLLPARVHASPDFAQNGHMTACNTGGRVPGLLHDQHHSDQRFRTRMCCPPPARARRPVSPSRLTPPLAPGSRRHVCPRGPRAFGARIPGSLYGSGRRQRRLCAGHLGAAQSFSQRLLAVGHTG
jgi:hypothetical protein